MEEVLKRLVEWGGTAAIILSFFYFWRKIYNGKS